MKHALAGLFVVAPGVVLSEEQMSYSLERTRAHLSLQKQSEPACARGHCCTLFIATVPACGSFRVCRVNHYSLVGWQLVQSRGLSIIILPSAPMDMIHPTPAYVNPAFPDLATSHQSVPGSQISEKIPTIRVTIVPVAKRARPFTFSYLLSAFLNFTAYLARPKLL
jgi:hypothetical protein